MTKWQHNLVVRSNHEANLTSCLHGLEENTTVPQIVAKIDEQDTSSVYRIEDRDDELPVSDSSGSSDNSSHKTVIHWDDGDPENPYNWSTVGA